MTKFDKRFSSIGLSCYYIYIVLADVPIFVNFIVVISSRYFHCIVVFTVFSLFSLYYCCEIYVFVIVRHNKEGRTRLVLTHP